MTMMTPLTLENADLTHDTFSTIFGKYGDNFELMKEYLNKIGLVHHIETFTAVSGQTNFTLREGTYPPSVGVLEVTIDSVTQYLHEGYEEVSATEFRITEALSAGQKVKATYYETNTATRTIYVDNNYSLNGGLFTDAFNPDADRTINGGNFLDAPEVITTRSDV